MARRVSPRSAAPAAVIVAAAACLLTACAPFGTSRRERVERFEADLNYNREFVYENFLESATSQYAQIRDDPPGATWDVWFPVPYPEGGNYYISIDNLFSNPIQATVDGPDIFDGPKSLQLHMVRSGVYWYLKGLTLEGDPIVD
jgi:hypothetical protein